MKKIIAGLSAFALAGMMTMTAYATAAGTTINPKGGDPFDVTPDTASANTTITYKADPAYTVTIPSKVTLSDTADVTTDITASNVRLMSTQKILVKISGTSELKVKSSSAEIAYSLSNETGALTPGGTAATFQTPAPTMTAAEKTAALTETLTFGKIASDAVTYAGDYTGTLTFDISVSTAG